MRNDLSLPECIRALTKARRTHAKPDIVTMLIGQCKNYDTYPNMAPGILETVAQLEGTAP